ncbi:MAG: UvrB/UvrC motif-containing protein [Planctomycetota bacterium]
MLCHHCNERDATIHEVVIHDGQRAERHLCERCARQLGVVGGAKPGQETPEMHGPTRPLINACDSCGLTYAEFKDLELLGCPRCYAAFERQLSGLLERTHEGGTHHVGKVPRRALDSSRSGRSLDEVLGDQAEREARLSQLREQLDDAVRSEHYERAGRIRDEIRRISGMSGAARVDQPEAEGGRSDAG